MSTKSADGRQHSTDSDDFEAPREMHFFSPTEHFLQRFSHRHGPRSATRHPRITTNVIQTCLEEGEFSSLAGDDSRYAYEAEVGPYRWRLVVAIDEDVAEHGGTHDLITAYTVGAHQ